MWSFLSSRAPTAPRGSRRRRIQRWVRRLRALCQRRGAGSGAAGSSGSGSGENCCSAVVAAAQLLLLLLLSFCAALYALSWLRADGKSVLLESTPLLACGPSAAGARTAYCEDVHAAPHFRFPAPFLLLPSPRSENAPVLLPSPMEWPLGLGGAVQQSAYRPLPWPGLVLITYCSSLYFDRLLNLIGSVHLFEPGQRIWVYDLGMTRMQRSRLRCLAFVTVRRMQFGEHPLHVSNLFNYAWKILVMAEVARYAEPSSPSASSSASAPGLAADLAGEAPIDAFILMDSGAELSKPNALTPLKAQLRRRGFWGVVQSNWVLKKTNPQTLAMLGVDLGKLEGRMFCAGGLIAFVINSEAYRRIMPPAVACALQEACIAPLGAGRGTHNYDQSILSALIHTHGFHCEARRQYREWDMWRLTLSPSSYNENVIALRRWHHPKPYATMSFLMQNLSSTLVAKGLSPGTQRCSFMSDEDMAQMTAMKHVALASWERWQRWKEAALNPQLAVAGAATSMPQTTPATIIGAPGIDPTGDEPPSTSLTADSPSAASPAAAAPPVLLLEQTDGSYMHDHSPLMRCLRKHSHQRLPCATEIEHHLQKMIASRRNFESTWLNILALDAWATPLLRAIKMDMLATMGLLLTCTCTIYIANRRRTRARAASSASSSSSATAALLSHTRSSSSSSSSSSPVAPLLAIPPWIRRFWTSMMLRWRGMRSPSLTGDAGHLSGHLRDLHGHSHGSGSGSWGGIGPWALGALLVALLSVMWLRSANLYGVSSAWSNYLLTHSYVPRRHWARTNRVLPSIGHTASEASGPLSACSMHDIACAVSAGWTPSVRVVAALTLDLLPCAVHTPEGEDPPLEQDGECRLATALFDKLALTLDSLAEQQHARPMAIYLSIALHPPMSTQVDEHLRALLDGGGGGADSSVPTFRGIPLVVTRSHSAGPLFVLRSVLPLEPDESTVVLVVRAGVAYPPLHSLRLLWPSEVSRVHGLEPTVYGGCGWSFLTRPDPVGIIPVYSGLNSGQRVDVLQHSCGVAYRRGFFTPQALARMDEANQHVASHCWFHSEIWLTGALLNSGAHSSGVPIAQVVLPPAEDDELPRAPPGDSSLSLREYRAPLRLSVSEAASGPAGEGRDAASRLTCIRAVEAVFGDWRGTMRSAVREQMEEV